MERTCATKLARSLSEILTQDQTLHTKSSLELPLQQIDKIGRISPSIEWIETVDLSNNDISSLEGIDYFPYLRILNLSNNLIMKITSLEPLFSLCFLEDLNLSSNPVCGYSVYRPLLIFKLFSLQTLDEVKVLSKERLMSDKLIRNQEFLTQNLIENEENIGKLEHLQQKLKIHRQLIVSNQLENYSSINVKYVLKLIKLPFLSELKGTVGEWVYEQINTGIKQNQDIAWDECLDLQNDKIKVLLEACETLAKECSILFEGKKYIEARESIDNAFGSPKKIREEEDLLRSSSPVYNLNSRMSLIHKKNEDTSAIYSAIKEGLTVVVGSFRKVKLQSKAFYWLKNATCKQRQIRNMEKNNRERWTWSVTSIVLGKWKKWALDEGKIRRNVYKNCLKAAQKHLFIWIKFTQYEKKIAKFETRKNLLLKKKVFSGIFKLLSGKYTQGKISTEGGMYTESFKPRHFEEESSLRTKEDYMHEKSYKQTRNSQHSKREYTNRNKRASHISADSSFDKEESYYEEEPSSSEKNMFYTRKNSSFSRDSSKNKREFQLGKNKDFLFEYEEDSNNQIEDFPYQTERYIYTKKRLPKEELSYMQENKYRKNQSKMYSNHRSNNPDQELNNDYKKYSYNSDKIANFSKNKHSEPKSYTTKQYPTKYQSYFKNSHWSQNSSKLLLYFTRNKQKNLLLRCFKALKPKKNSNLHKRVKTLEKVVFMDVSHKVTPLKFESPSFLVSSRNRRNSFHSTERSPPMSSRKEGFNLILSIHKQLDVLEDRLLTKRRILY